MSLESVLERMTVALEKQNEMTAKLLGKDQPKVEIPPPAKVVKEKGAPKAAPTVAATEPTAEAEQDPFADPEQKELTLDTLKELLTAHAKAFGNKVTVALILKHGADTTTPKIATIPQKNWKVCYEEATGDLKKVQK